MIERADITPLPAVDWGNGDIRDITLLKVTTTDGLTGLGSAYTGTDRVREALAHYERDSNVRQPADAATTIAMSAIDIALWDIRGQKEGLPVSELLGGRKRDRVLAYATIDLPMTGGNAFERILRTCVEQGFKAIKLCIEGFGQRDNSLTNTEWDRREAGLLEFARKTAGKNIRLMLDVYGSDPDWTPAFDWALKTARSLETLDFLWFEEPLSPRDFAGFAQLTEQTTIAITGAEDFVLLTDFQTVANRRALDILQPDCTRVGGLTQMQAIRQLARQNGLHVIPHGWNSAIGLAADLHFQATEDSEQYGMVEFWPDETITGLLKDNPFALDEEGRIAVPTGPGLGVTLNNDFLETISA